MSHGRTPLCESSTIFRRMGSGRGRPLTNMPPSWFTPPCPLDPFAISEFSMSCSRMSDKWSSVVGCRVLRARVTFTLIFQRFPSLEPLLRKRYTRMLSLTAAQPISAERGDDSQLLREAASGSDDKCACADNSPLPAACNYRTHAIYMRGYHIYARLHSFIKYTQ